MEDFEYPPKYLVRKDRDGVAHTWLPEIADTMCGLFATQRYKPIRYEVWHNDLGKPLCKSCAGVEEDQEDIDEELEICKIEHTAVSTQRDQPKPPPPYSRKFSFVYFIQAGGRVGPIKIGWSYDPVERLSTLQVSQPEKLEIIGVTFGGHKVEQKLHKQFESSRIRGEWFRPTVEMVDLIIALNDRMARSSFARRYERLNTARARNMPARW